MRCHIKHAKPVCREKIANMSCGRVYVGFKWEKSSMHCSHYETGRIKYKTVEVARFVPRLGRITLRVAKVVGIDDETYEQVSTQ